MFRVASNVTVQTPKKEWSAEVVEVVVLIKYRNSAYESESVKTNGEVLCVAAPVPTAVMKVRIVLVGVETVYLTGVQE